MRTHFEVRGAVPALDSGTLPRSSLDGVVPWSSDRAVPFECAAGRLTQAKVAYFALKTSKAAEGDPGRLIVNESRQTALGGTLQIDTIGLGEGRAPKPSFGAVPFDTRQHAR